MIRNRRTLVALSLGLCSCVPWTVRPIDENHEATPAFSVDSLWTTKLVPAILRQAVDVRALLDTPDARTRYGHHEANGPVYFIVKGEGVVLSVDTKSRVGLALIDVAPYDQKPDLSIQIGPVLRGTSLRDATGIVRFTDFVNQLQFADVANELNDRVLKTVLASVDKATLKGRKISFVGTVAASEPPLRELLPIRLKVEERR